MNAAVVFSRAKYSHQRLLRCPRRNGVVGRVLSRNVVGPVELPIRFLPKQSSASKRSKRIRAERERLARGETQAAA